MKDETKQELDKLMETYGQKREEKGKRAAKRQAEEIEFDADFSVCRDDIIRPAMEEIGDHLRKGGHAYQIYSSDEDVDAFGKPTPAEVTILFYPAGIDRARFTGKAGTPHVSFMANPRTRKVSISASDRILGGGGASGAKGEFPLDQINRDFVEEQILTMVREVLGK